MPCRVRYLNSAGIMRREIPGIDALAKAFPKEWLLYASLNCYPRNQSPMEIDALVVIDDRVLLLELKDWNGTLTQRGDQWFVGGKSRGRSPVVLGEEKAKKLKTVLRTEIPTLTSLYVEARVVLTASATRDGIADQEKPYVWTIAQACSIADTNARAALLSQRKLGLLKAYNFEQDFDRVTNNTKVFQPLEADWGGYRVSESNVVVHPNGVWAEHKAERNNEARMKALVRIWAFDRLPPGLNSSDRRKLIAHRENKVVAHLMTVESPLLERNAILRDIGPSNDEILTNHFDLRELSPNWNTWDRFLERSQDDFDISDRILAATTLLSLIADLHKGGIAHRDLGPRCIWVGSPSKMALNGFMCCQLPGEESVEDWLTTLKGYAVHSAEDEATSINGSGRQRDVFSVGQLVAGVLGDARTCESTALPPSLPDELSHFQEWLDSATAVDPDVRFSDGVAMAARFASLAESVGTIEIDQELLDRHETTLIPYVAWPQREALVQDARRSVYLSVGPDGEQVVVKVWNGMHRNVSAATDLALLRLLESAARVQASPVVGLPVFRKIGLSPIGPFVVYRHIAGNSLDSVESLPTDEALSISEKLLTCVVALHELECEHGDIAAKNVLLNSETKDVCLLDAFDISPVGIGEMRTPSLCPIGWEKLDQRSLDRYATLRVVKETLEKCADARLSDAIDSIDRELARPIVETLEVGLAIVRQAHAAISKPAKPTFTIYHPSGFDGFFRPDGDGYFLTHRVDTGGEVRYALCGIDRELVFSTRDGMLSGSEFLRLPFGALSYASRKGIKVAVDISVLPGRASGLLPLFDFAKANAGPVSTEVGLVSATPVSDLDVPRYWDRLIDLEASNKLELEIVDEIAFSDGIGIYTYEPSGTVPDFDP